MFSKQLLGKTPSWMLFTAAYINGKDTPTASFISLSQLTSFFLKKSKTKEKKVKPIAMPIYKEETKPFTYYDY